MLTRVIFLLTKIHNIVLISANREFFKNIQMKKNVEQKKGKNSNIHTVYYVQARKLNQQTDMPLLCWIH